LQPEVLLQFFQQKNKRKRPSKTNHNNNRLNLAPINPLLNAADNIPLDKILKVENCLEQSSSDIQIEEINSVTEEEDEMPPLKQTKREPPTEIEVKVHTDPNQTHPKPSPISGSSRRKGTSQRIAPSVVMNQDGPIDGVEEWLTNGKSPVKSETP
jgi:hypothetical protein